ncbi:hypothetical protein DPMN_100398 [Dreissena polymorpha]|uniref:Uncharacterized protein n=1 Tax=Dreissena polymorpha TaxID=45954 RepID=A0A9D4LFV2_DREPO|nr:hypothetical protein DPMN_100398 [Dreissena polymorpha]
MSEIFQNHLLTHKNHSWRPSNGEIWIGCIRHQALCARLRSWASKKEVAVGTVRRKAALSI